MTFQSLVTKALVLGASFATFAAYAQQDPGGSPLLPNTVPEPGAWALIGLAAAIGATVSRKRK